MEGRERREGGQRETEEGGMKKKGKRREKGQEGGE